MRWPQGRACLLEGSVCHLSGSVCHLSGSVCHLSGSGCRLSGSVCRLRGGRLGVDPEIDGEDDEPSKVVDGTADQGVLELRGD